LRKVPVSLRHLIAADNAVHPDVVVKEIPRDRTGNFVDVVAGRHPLDLHNLGSSKAPPVEALRCKEVLKFLSKLIEEHIGIWSDKNICAQKDNGSGENVLIGVVTIWKPDW